MVKKAALGLRIWGLVFCLISFAVMASDKNKGWALDSFYRYKEFRYCISVNVVGFMYSAVQACDLAFHFSTGNYVVRHQLRYYFDFLMDQNQQMEERSEWKTRWQAQLSELKRRSMNKDARGNMSWGARMRRQRNDS